MLLDTVKKSRTVRRKIHVDMKNIHSTALFAQLVVRVIYTSFEKKARFLFEKVCIIPIDGINLQALPGFYENTTGGSRKKHHSKENRKK